MFVVPFFLRPRLPSLIQWELVPITLFLENHGKHLCSTEDPSVWLVENGFIVKQTWRDGDTVFAELDTQKTALRDFYSFEQLTMSQQKGTEECWRTFFLMKSKEGEKSSETTWNENIENSISKTILAIQKHIHL